MRRLTCLLAILVALLAAAAPATAAAPGALATAPQIYGAWHCGNDFCTWGAVRTVAEFDSANHWLIDRGDGRPSVNLVVLSFVNPLRLLRQTTDATTVAGVPRGMTPEIVNYFTSRGVRVMLSIGGITYTDDWDTALSENAALLGQRAAAVATQLGVGIEIDYEQNTNPNLPALQSFIDAYRAVHPYDATGARAAARLTIDVAAGDRWLIALNRKATADWLRTDTPVLDYANAMVTARPASAANAIADWQEHVDGKPQYGPPVPPLAPAKFTGAIYVAYGGKPLPECVNYPASVQNAAAPYVQSVAPNGAGTTAGMLGFMFWAAERPAVRGIGTVPPNTCQAGVGAGATALAIQIPMPSLRQS
ncbi:hypothetical protein [Asanoa iriomotensis]|uniref:Glycosyl hydrolase family 18 (Putative chitinase) n=1 Tax=Asanoa iriomotensis TaxID=234613 RepID=A0ABQ4BUL5_9ACTN|nr:hypothetical protein [Asanoa iriomotensis]GIF54219.1 hypothetical protein Air01nite_03140 [Asanoa iriomotensis]